MTAPSKDVEIVREILGNISSLIPDHYGGQPNLVTRDMALDAGEPGLEGSLHSYAPCPGDCPRCLFDQSNDQALAALDRLVAETRWETLLSIMDYLGSKEAGLDRSTKLCLQKWLDQELDRLLTHKTEGNDG